MEDELKKLESDPTKGFAKALSGKAEDEAIRDYVQEGRGALPGSCHLLGWDANSVHSLVFDTTNAAGIRGASAILKRVDKDLRKGAALGLHESQILFAGGGHGMAVVAAEQVGEIERCLHGYFAEQTLTATCSVASVGLGGEAYFGQKIAELERIRARRRLKISPFAEPVAPFFVERCGVCGRRAAAVGVKRLNDPRLECGPCVQRINRGRDGLKHVRGEEDSYERISDADGFLAVVYADGNGIGQILEGLKSPLESAIFSHSLQNVFSQAFEETAKRHGMGDEADREAGGEARKYQLPIQGGDDLIAIVPGDIATRFAADLLRKIRDCAEGDEGLRKLGKARDIGASAGVAIGKDGFPIRHLLAESEELLKSAKKRVYREKEAATIEEAEKDPQRAPCALDFAVVYDGAPRVESAERPRMSEGGEPDALHMTGRPYALDELYGLMCRVDLFRGARARVGRSQLYALRRVAEAGPAQLRNHVLFQVARRPEWRELLNRLGDREVDAKESADFYMKQVILEQGEQKIFDLGDVIELERHWAEAKNEPGEEVRS